MKTVYLVRHAKAKKDLPGVSDINRPLAKRGKDEAERMGVWFQQHQIQFDLLFCSPALRARETVATFLPFLPLSLQTVEYREELYPSDTEVILNLLSKVESGNVVMVCGHNPAIEDLASIWANKRIDSVRTCGCFKAVFPIDRWESIRSVQPTNWEYFDPDTIAD